MAPSKKSRTASRRHSQINVSPLSKNVDTPSKSRHRKRKVSDLLGPQWSKEEIERFYKGYRKIGPDWKKVAAVVRTRSIEMVEALYTMNRAYLSLPKGHASVAGLIAMMTDHYANMGESGSDQDMNEDTESSQKPSKRARVSKASERTLIPAFTASHPDSSDEGCLSLLIKRRYVSKPWSVGKRTPRVPVSFSTSKENGENRSSVRRGIKLKNNSLDDDVAHEIALALAEASQRGGSPQKARTPSKAIHSASPLKNGGYLKNEVEMTSDKTFGDDNEEAVYDKNLRSRDSDASAFSKVKSPLKTILSNKMPELDEGMDNGVEDIKEACSGTEEGQDFDSGTGKLHMDNVGVKTGKTSNKGLRKRGKKIHFGEDDDTSFQALQALADLSLSLPENPADTESSVDVKDENIASTTKSKLKGNNIAFGSLKPTKHGSNLPNDTSVLSKEVGVVHSRSHGVRKRRQKQAGSNLKVSVEGHLLDAKDNVSESNTSSKHVEPLNAPGNVLVGDHVRKSSCVAMSTSGVLSSDELCLPTKVRSRRKMRPSKQTIETHIKLPTTASNGVTDVVASSEDKSYSQREILANSLSWCKVRRWCTYEWFYSAIDYPWFSKREFVEYLDHVGLGHIPKLTQVEWGVIRSSLGKPRRFSQQFLMEEKEKLYQYRESVRKHYSDLRSGMLNGLPTDLSRPLSVGQRVVALHPRTREMNDGSVLTVDHKRCRIQFDQPELGVEFVTDVDCMPLNPTENMPASASRHNLPCKPLEFETKPRDLSTITGRYVADNLFHPAKDGMCSPITSRKTSLSQSADIKPSTYAQLSFGTNLPAKEADIYALSELKRALDKKEVVVSELKRMNDEVVENRNDLKNSESFKKQYASVILQLNEANEQVSSALLCLRQRNTYQATSQPVWFKTEAGAGDPLAKGYYDAMDEGQDSTPLVADIVETSRSKAQSMVAAAIHAMPKDKHQNIEETIDLVNNRLSTEDPCSKSASAHQECAEDKAWRRVIGNGALKGDDDARFPSQLVSECVAALLMIQRCTERQFPPGDVAQVLDSAVSNLKPCCPQNIPIYAEIQKCMGIIKNQILALVPT